MKKCDTQHNATRVAILSLIYVEYLKKLLYAKP